MAKKILVNALFPEEIRVALAEEGTLIDFSIEIAAKGNIKGNIYKGIVTHIEPSFQAAFVNFGGARDGFLPFDEIHPEFWIRKSSAPERKPKIQDIMSKKQEVLVQVTREEIGTKGAALTTEISLPGRYVVLMYGSQNIGVSRKIEDDDQRKKLKDIAREFGLPEGMGIIIRTAGMNRSKKELTTDFRYLMELWDTIMTRSKEVTAPALIYQESDVVVKSIRENFTHEVREVIIDEPGAYRRAQEFFERLMPKYRRRVKHYQGAQPLFSRFQIEQQIESIYAREVPLKSGGRICIDNAEALVAIDVNSGRVAQASDIEEAALITNLEAAEEAARQLRLRDIGGLIVVDFIDMKSAQHNREVERRLRAALKKDRAKVDTSRISKFGILEISRQRLKSPLSEGVYTNCRYCQGKGRIRSAYSVALTVLRKIQERVLQNNVGMVKGVLCKAVADYLLNYKRDELNEIEGKYDLKIVIVGQEDLPVEEYQLEFMKSDRTLMADAAGDVPAEKWEKEKPWYRRIFPF